MSDEQDTKREIVRSDVGREVTQWSTPLVKRALSLADGILQRHSAKQALAHYNIGNALLEKNDFDGAIREYYEAVRLDPAHADAHSALAGALWTRRDLDGAVRHYHEAARLSPESGTYFVLGLLLGDKGDPDKAIEAFREALLLDPADHDSLDMLCFTLRDNGEIDAAIHEYQEFLRLNPASADAHYYFGQALRDMGDMDGAIREYRKAIHEFGGARSWNHADAQFRLGVALRSKGDRAGAIEAFRAYLRIHGDPPPGVEWKEQQEARDYIRQLGGTP